MTEKPLNIELAIEARWVVPATSQRQILEYMTLIVDQGCILDILPIEQARRRYSAQQTVCLNEHILIPGLINLHTHAAMTLLRGLADDLPLMPWLQEHIWPAENAWLSWQFVRDGSLLACAEMLAGGVTCFNDMYFFPQATAEASMQAGIRAHLGLVVLEFASIYANDAEDYLQKGLDARDSLRSNPLLSFSLAPHAPYSVENSTFEKVMTYSEQLGLGIHTHLHETKAEIELGVARYGMRPLRRLLDIGLLGPDFIAAHGVHLLPDEMEILAAHGCHIVHCPSSNLKLASGFAPVVELLNQGVNVGLGTDGAASNNRLDMFAEMRLAALLAKGVSGDAGALPAAQALEMATINAARALGLDGKIGSIEIGKFADLCAVRLADPETLPCFDPLSHLVYVCGREHVSHVWVAGVLRYEKIRQQDGIFANIEPAELKEMSVKWQSKLTKHK